MLKECCVVIGSSKKLRTARLILEKLWFIKIERMINQYKNYKTKLEFNYR